MRKLSKTHPAPPILRSNDCVQAQGTLDNEVNLNKGKLSFDKHIYGDSTVKAQLKSDQHEKCAYCERRKSGDFGDIDHYRPKAEYTVNNIKSKPGYYWLAYEWENLIFSCTECNRTYKKSNFPLLDENKRDIINKNINTEYPLIINPYVDNPVEHICFARHIIKPVMKDGVEDSKGRYTIDLFKLNDRRDLLTARREIWNQFLTYKQTIQILETFKDLPGAEAALKENIDRFNEMISDQAPHVGMLLNQE